MSIKLGGGQKLSSSTFSSTLHCGVEGRPLEDSRLLFTGPSPFGWHRYESFLKCPSQYGWNYGENPLPSFDAQGALVPAIRKNERNDARPLVLGTLVHLGLAHYYARLQAKQHGVPTELYEPLEAIDVLTRTEIEEAPPAASKTWQTCADLAKEVMVNYVSKYAFERVTVEHVEEVFRLDINGAPITMRVDLVVSDTAGRVYMVDHKTTGRMTANHPKFYGISGQFLAYGLAGKLAFGERFGGVMLNLIECREGSIRFDRPELAASPGLQVAFPATVARTWEQIKALAGTPPAEWPRHPTEHTCWTRYGPCKHFDKCRLGLKE